MRRDDSSNAWNVKGELLMKDWKKSGLLGSAVLAGAMLAAVHVAFAQVEGPVKTQALVAVDSKQDVAPSKDDVTFTVDGKKADLTSWAPVPSSNAQIALLIDDGLREAVGRELSDLRDWIGNLPAGTQIYIGYMRDGGVYPVQPFTTDHETASKTLRLPSGIPGVSASPYFCLSAFVKQWPAQGPGARFVMMITSGVDPYNGSTSILNQDSPYVDAAIRDAQEAGVSVSSIYFGDAGIRGGSANFSGQSYLAQTSSGTGGVAYYEGRGNPVSMTPYLKEFNKAIKETYVATFTASPTKKNQLYRIKANIKEHGVKLHTADAVAPGNLEVPSAN